MVLCVLMMKCFVNFFCDIVCKYWYYVKIEFEVLFDIFYFVYYLLGVCNYFEILDFLIRFYEGWWKYVNVENKW